jgi:hypothetical protein
VQLLDVSCDRWAVGSADHAFRACSAGCGPCLVNQLAPPLIALTMTGLRNEQMVDPRTIITVCLSRAFLVSFNMQARQSSL